MRAGKRGLWQWRHLHMEWHRGITSDGAWVARGRWEGQVARVGVACEVGVLPVWTT
jgi:hypothetical protein